MQVADAVWGVSVADIGHTWRTWRGLSGQEHWLALGAWLALPLIALALRAAGFKRAQRSLARWHVGTLERWNMETCERAARTLEMGTC